MNMSSVAKKFFPSKEISIQDTANPEVNQQNENTENNTPSSYATEQSVSPETGNKLKLQKPPQENIRRLTSRSPNSFDPNLRTSIKSALSSVRSSIQSIPSWLFINRTLTTRETINHLLCALCGSNIPAHPLFFQMYGIIPSLGVGCIYYILCPVVILHVVKIKNKISSDAERTLNMVGAVEYALALCPHWMSIWEKCVRRCITAWIVCYHLCICIFVLEYASRSIIRLVQYDNPGMLEACKIFLLLPLIFLTNIRGLHWLSYTSLIGNICFACTAVGMLIKSLRKLIFDQGISNKIVLLGDHSHIYDFVENVMFSLCPVALVLQIEERMFSPETFTGIKGNFVISYMSAITIDIVLCLICTSIDDCFLRWDSKAPDDIITSVTKAFFIANLFTKYALHFYACATSLWQNHLHARVPINLQTGWPNVLFRIFLNSSVVVLTVFLPYSKRVFSVAVAVSSCALFFLFPVMIDVLHACDKAPKKQFKFVLARNGLLLVFGIITTVFATIGSLHLLGDAVVQL